MLNSKEDLQKILEMNKSLEEIKRDYINKSARSWKSAENIILRNKYYF
jgi:hypothetical protein